MKMKEPNSADDNIDVEPHNNQQESEKKMDEAEPPNLIYNPHELVKG